MRNKSLFVVFCGEQMRSFNKLQHAEDFIRQNPSYGFLIEYQQCSIEDIGDTVNAS